MGPVAVTQKLNLEEDMRQVLIESSFHGSSFWPRFAILGHPDGPPIVVNPLSY